MAARRLKNLEASNPLQLIIIIIYMLCGYFAEQGGLGGELAKPICTLAHDDRYGKLHFNLDYYTEVPNFEYYLDTFPEDNFTKKLV